MDDKENLDFMAKIINPYNENFLNDIKEYNLRNYNYSYREFDISEESKNENFKYHYLLSNFPRNIYLQGRKILNSENEEIGIIIFYYNIREERIVIYYLEFLRTKDIRDIDSLVRSVILSEFGTSEVSYNLEGWNDKYRRVWP